MVDEWRSIPFSEVLSEPVRNGLTRPKRVRGDGVKMVNMGELFAHPRIGNIDMERVPVSEDEAHKYFLQKGDLLFARQSLVLSGAGKCSIFLDATEPTTFEGHLIRARLNRDVADPLFYFYFFNSPHGQQAIASIVEQVAAAGIRGSDLVRLSVPRVTIKQQQAIACILGALDDKIELNRRMNETLEAIAQAIFKSWFVDATRDGLPEGWRESTVDQEFNLTMGQSPPGKTYNESGNGIPFFQGRTDFGFRFPTKRVFCTAPTRFAEAGDTLVSVRAPVGSVNMAAFKCCIGRGVAAIRHKTGSRSYTYYFMRSLEPEFTRFEAEGTVFGSINKSDFHKIEFIAPPARVVEGFEKLLFPIDQRIENNEAKARTVASLRDALLPKLILGELRVPDAERIVARCA